MEGTDICFAPVLSMDEAPLHPHNAARQAFVQVNGQTQPAPAPRFMGTPAQHPDAAGTPGAQTDVLLAALGHDATAIADFRARGVIS